MSLQRLTLWIVLVELVGLGVLFAFTVLAAISTGGQITLDATKFGERWIEYIVVLVLLALTPYALYFWTK